MNREQTERKICAAICQSNGLKAKDIAQQLNLDRSTVNRVLYASPLLKDLCYQDDSYRWHGIIRQSVPHDGLYEFSGYYAKVSDFLSLTEDEWMDELMKGCQRIGRNLNDTRGLLHSFRDCWEQMINLFTDLRDMLGMPSCTRRRIFTNSALRSDLKKCLLVTIPKPLRSSITLTAARS